MRFVLNRTSLRTFEVTWEDCKIGRNPPLYSSRSIPHYSLGDNNDTFITERPHTIVPLWAQISTQAPHSVLLRGFLRCRRAIRSDRPASGRLLGTIHHFRSFPRQAPPCNRPRHSAPAGATERPRQPPLTAQMSDREREYQEEIERRECGQRRHPASQCPYPPATAASPEPRPLVPRSLPQA